jgi:hypothetical protein
MNQIQKDLARVRLDCDRLGTEMQQAYGDYFQVFAIAVKQQAIQACYHLCTRSYPEAFLTLTDRQRSQLIKSLQRSIVNSLDHLGEEINPGTDGEEREALKFDYPLEIAHWHSQIEAAIRITLKRISHKCNLTLAQAKILPGGIPLPILEAAMDIERRTEKTPHQPHILSVAVDILESPPQRKDREEEPEETEDEEIFSPSRAKPMQTLRLQLAEVELADAHTTIQRKQIDMLTHQVRACHRELMKTQATLTKVAAEVAWNRSWQELD